MSGYPILLEGDAIRALIVGGGRVATRKARALLAAGATVRLVAPQVDPEMIRLSETEPRLTIAQRAFVDDDLRDAIVIIAATGERGVNARVAQIAREGHRLVSVADAPSESSFVGMATHRAGDVVVGVSAGGVPRAAARIRDSIGARIDGRYAQAVGALRSLRRRLLDAGATAEWNRAMSALVDERFCARVEGGTLASEADAWR